MEDAGGEWAREPWNVVGIKSWDVAPTGQAVCWWCKAKIDKGSVRFDYRLKATKLLSDQRRFHPRCIKDCPAETRARDIRYVKHMLEGDLPEHARAVIKEALESLELAV